MHLVRLLFYILSTHPFSQDLTPICECRKNLHPPPLQSTTKTEKQHLRFLIWSIMEKQWGALCVCEITSSNEECVNMSSCAWPMRGVMTEVGGVIGVMAGDGPSESRTSLSGLSNDTSSVASAQTHTSFCFSISPSKFPGESLLCPLCCFAQIRILPTAQRPSPEWKHWETSLNKDLTVSQCKERHQSLKIRNILHPHENSIYLA